MRPVGIDVSKYQHPINWTTLDNANPAFFIHRATIGSLYIDPFLVSAINAIKLTGIPWTAYHVIRPDYKAFEQANNFINALKLAKAENTWMPLVLDCELDKGKSREVIAQVIYDVANQVQDWHGRKIMIYTRKSWWDVYVGNKAWAANFDWWEAYYPSGDWKAYTRLPPLATGVDPQRLLIHQVSPNGDGRFYGTASLGVDVNYWLAGEWDGLASYIKDYCGLDPWVNDKPLDVRVAKLETEARARGWEL